MDQLIIAPVAKLAQEIRARRVSSQEAVQAYLNRIEDVNPRLNAVVQLLAEQALDTAKASDGALASGEIWGPLHGVPMTIKDSFDTAGVISTGGTQGRRSHVPAHDATVVRRLRAAGAVLLGKSNTPELTMAGETDNLVYGRTNNPYDLSSSPGGSSGGSAAIVAAGGSPFDVGSDTGGSIRLPCHYCGVAGIKPTSGRVARTGHFPPPGGVMDWVTQPGPVTRYVADLALVLSIIAGIDWRDPAVVPMPIGDPNRVVLNGLRLAFYTDNGIEAPAPEIDEVVRRAARLLADVGMIVEEDRPEGLVDAHQVFMGLQGADRGAWMRRELQNAGTTQMHPILQRFLDATRSEVTTAAQLDELVLRADSFRSHMLAFVQRYDAILCPVSPYTRLPHGYSLDSDPSFGISSYSYTTPYNLTGWPCTVVRAGTSPMGMPIGVQVAAHPWREDVSLAAAQAIETALGGWKPPAL